MSKDEMINWLLHDIESDRYRVVGSANADSAQLNQAIKAEWSRLSALSHGEIEALYLKLEEPYTMSA